MEKAFLLVYTSACSCGIFLTLFYWLVVYNGETIRVDNVSRHGVNVIFMLGDLVLSKVPICSYHLQVCCEYTVATLECFVQVCSC